MAAWIFDDRRYGTEILRQSVAVAPYRQSPADTTVARWYAEAAGFKVRYVPANIPDIVKTEALLEHEYGHWREPAVDQAVEKSRRQLQFGRIPDNDMEICLSVQAIRDLCHGHSLWRGLAKTVRRSQQEQIATVLKDLYPGVRLYLFDGLRRFASPYTIFGNRRAALYIGQLFITVNTPEHVALLIRHFDDLIRNCVINAHETAAFIRRLEVS